MRILYVEDERRMAEAVAEVLRRNNYSVDLAGDGEEGAAFALSGLYDIIILDIMLPKLDGIGVLSRIRKAGLHVPVILLTAKGETEDKVAGLDSGADDYLSKPFQTSELLARLRALSRRRGGVTPDNLLRFSDISLNPNTLELNCGERGYRLTLKESQLMELLIVNRGMLLSADSIIEKLWGFDGEAEDNHVQVYVSFLRKKLALLGSAVRIQTVRGAGYMLSEEKPGERNEG